MLKLKAKLYQSIVGRVYLNTKYNRIAKGYSLIEILKRVIFKLSLIVYEHIWSIFNYITSTQNSSYNHTHISYAGCKITN